MSQKSKAPDAFRNGAGKSQNHGVADGHRSGVSSYDHKQIEAKWQKRWEEEGLYRIQNSEVRSQNKLYVLPQLPYPSGDGLHVGHAEVYTACDIYARAKRMQGKDVLQVIGWDAFGLPAENYAIKNNVHPKIITNKAIDNFRYQIKRMGVSVDWDREVGSHNPDYYKWTQWWFLLMYKQGLAYRKKQTVNWCEGCKTVLANEQVVKKIVGENPKSEVLNSKQISAFATATADRQNSNIKIQKNETMKQLNNEINVCERCGTEIIQKQMEQWYLKITEYADRLYKDLDKVDWPEETVVNQRNWIGKKEGTEITFKLRVPGQGEKHSVAVFTTRPDTLYGVTFLVIAPELAQEWIKVGWNASEEVKDYIKHSLAKQERQRLEEQKEKTGVPTGIEAVHPLTGEPIQVWVADYVLMDYGTGAVMGVPAHDERDGEFAQKHGLKMVSVIKPDFAGYLVIEKSLEGNAHSKLEEFGEVRIEKQSKDWGNFYRVCVPLDKETDLVEFLKTNLRSTSDDGGTWYADSMGTTNMVVFPGKSIEVQDMKGLEAFKDQGRMLGIPEEQLDIELDKVIIYAGNGKIVNSGDWDNWQVPEDMDKVLSYLEEKGLGKRKTTFRLRDWSVSRQRFWGAPIPMVYDSEGNIHPVKEEDLPVKLPEDVDFMPTGKSPLTYSEDFQKDVEEKYGNGWRREVDTLDTFMCSSWYYFRYIDPHNDQAFAAPEALRTWMPVDFYIGGPEHTNGHLLYSRFFTKVLHDAGYIDFDEPFLMHRHQGLILGEDNRKMSKRWGNVINPTEVMDRHGADTLRMYEMFMGPLSEAKVWNTRGELGIYRFLERIWGIFHDPNAISEVKSTEKVKRKLHQTVVKITKDIDGLRFNTAISAMMETLNVWKEEGEQLNREDAEILLKLLAPFAPHIAEELYEVLQSSKLKTQNSKQWSVHQQPWPEAEPKYLVEEEVEIAVQVNGRLRFTINIKYQISNIKNEVEKLVLGDERIKKWIENKEIKKVVFVPGRLVNVVI